MDKRAEFKSFGKSNLNLTSDNDIEKSFGVRSSEVDSDNVSSSISIEELRIGLELDDGTSYLTTDTEIEEEETDEFLGTEVISPKIQMEESEISRQLPTPTPQEPGETELHPIPSLVCNRSTLSDVEALMEFNSDKEIEVFDTAVLWKYPDGNEWLVRLVNLLAFRDILNMESIDFERLDDPDFEKSHQDLQKDLYNIYFWMRSHPEKKMPLLDIKRNRAAVADLGAEGFFRCVIGTECSALDGYVHVRIIDENFSRKLSIEALYPCLSRFGNLAVKRNDLCLAGLMLYNNGFFIPIYHELAWEYFSTHENKYRAVVRKLNTMNLAVVDLFTLDNPCVFVNQHFLGLITASFPGPTLPEVGQTIPDVYVSDIKSNGNLYVQINSYEYYCFRTMLLTIENGYIDKIIKDLGPFKLNSSTIYFSKYYVDDQYYRAELIQTPNAGSSSDRLGTGDSLEFGGVIFSNPMTWPAARFIDYGNVALVNPMELVPVEIVDHILTKFKPQALAVQLANVKRLDKQSLRDLVPVDVSVTLEVMSSASEKNSRPAVEVVILKGFPEYLGLRLRKDERAVLWDEPVLISSAPFEMQFSSLEDLNMRQVSWTLSPEEPFMVRPHVNLLVTITHSEGPNFIVIQRSRTSPWDAMDFDLTCWRKRQRKLDPVLSLTESKTYCYKSARLSKYVRVRLAEDPITNKTDKIQVLLIDYAQYECVRKLKLRPIGRQFCTLPPKSILASLPVEVTSRWTKQEVQTFDRVILNKVMCLRVLRINWNTCGLIKLTGDLYLHQALTGSDEPKVGIGFKNYEVRAKVPDEEFKFNLDTFATKSRI